MSDDNKIYAVLFRINFDNEMFEPGEAIALSEKQAQPLLDCAPPVIEPKVFGDVDDNDTEGSESTNVVQMGSKAPEDDAERLDAIKQVIATLDVDDVTQWTAAKAPDANVLKEKLGWKVSATERDEAWADMKPVVAEV